jgi:predicted  nucleic acid-binding Zn-ribbon protein
MADTFSQERKPLMLDAIEKLLVLQDRDRNLHRTQAELASIAPQRARAQNRASSSQQALDAAKLRAKQTESDKKKLELDVEALKERISKYSLQQFQTKKNEEYRALAHEIETCKGGISKLEDQILELMEQADVVAKEVATTTKAAASAKKDVEAEVAELGKREENFQQRLAELQSNRAELASAVEEGALFRYERLLKSKGENVIVGIQHSACGGCHMRLPTQVMVACQSQSELNACPHCGRIIYFTRDMELAAAE